MTQTTRVCPPCPLPLPTDATWLSLGHRPSFPRPPGAPTPSAIPRTPAGLGRAHGCPLRSIHCKERHGRTQGELAVSVRLGHVTAFNIICLYKDSFSVGGTKEGTAVLRGKRVVWKAKNTTSSVKASQTPRRATFCRVSRGLSAPT